MLILIFFMFNVIWWMNSAEIAHRMLSLTHLHIHNFLLHGIEFFSFKLDYFVHFMSMHCAHYIVNNKPGKIIAEITSPFTTYKSVPNYKIPWMEYRTPWNVRIIFVELILNLDMSYIFSYQSSHVLILQFDQMKKSIQLAK